MLSCRPECGKEIRGAVGRAGGASAMNCSIDAKLLTKRIVSVSVALKRSRTSRGTSTFNGWKSWSVRSRISARGLARGLSPNRVPTG